MVVLPTECRVTTNSVHGDRRVAQQELGDERSQEEEPHGGGGTTQEVHASSVSPGDGADVGRTVGPDRDGCPGGSVHVSGCSQRSWLPCGFARQPCEGGA